MQDVIHSVYGTGCHEINVIRIVTSENVISLAKQKQNHFCFILDQRIIFQIGYVHLVSFIIR